VLEGPLRFSESIWLRALREGGEAAPEYAGRIFQTSGGRFYVPTAADRRKILAARSDGALASRVARAFADANAKRLRAAVRHPATAGDLYIAHVFGPEAATRFLKLVKSEPQDVASAAAPELAQVAPTLFYSAGKPLTLAQVYRRLVQPLRTYARSAEAVAALRESRESALPSLKPTIADAAQSTPGAGVPRAATLAWQAEVSPAAAARPQ
jgi:hypothetical protein